MPRTIKEYRRRYINQAQNDITRIQNRMKLIEDSMTIPNKNLEYHLIINQHLREMLVDNLEDIRRLLG